MKIKSPAFLTTAMRRLTSRRRFEQRSSGVSAPGGGYGRAEWVLSRSLCRFARFELGAIPKLQREQALELQVRQWAPFENAGRYVAWEEGVALVWAWNADLVASSMAEFAISGSAARVFPETVFQERRLGGIELVSCMEGIEGRIWRDGVMAASRWWPKLPSKPDWIRFQRDAGMNPDALLEGLPDPAAPKWLERPWGRPSGLDAQGIRSHGERRLIPIVALCLLVPTFWYGAQLAKLWLAIGNRQSELAEMNRRSEPVITAREKALQARDRISQLQSALERYPDQASLMARTRDILSKSGATLKGWEFIGGKLKLQVATTTSVASSEFVKSFQSADTFRNVEAATGSDIGTLLLSMDVVPLPEVREAASRGRAPR